MTEYEKKEFERPQNFIHDYRSLCPSCNLYNLKDSHKLWCVYSRIMDERDTLYAKVERLTAALKSIAANSCCAPCREAGLVATAALREE